MNVDAILQLIATQIHDNTQGEITPSRLREVLNTMTTNAGAKVDDTAVALTSVFSSSKVQNLIDSTVKINDSVASGTTTYSSNKIAGLLSAVEQAALQINDTTASTSTVFSSSKINALLTEVDSKIESKINDTTASTTTAYSSTKVDTLISTAMANAGATIDDTAASVTTVYSSTKVNELISAIPAPIFTASNGLTKIGNDFTLGGEIAEWTELTGAGALEISTSGLWYYGNGAFEVMNTGDADISPDGNVMLYPSGNVQISTNTGNINISANLITIGRHTQKLAIDSTGGLVTLSAGTLAYASDYSTRYSTRSIVDKGYVDAAIAGANVVVNDASTNVKGIVKLSVAPAVATNPIALAANDTNVVFKNVVANFTATPQINGVNIATVNQLTAAATTRSANINDTDANEDTLLAYSCALDSDEIRLTVNTNSTITLTGGSADKIYKLVLIQNATGYKTVRFSNLNNTSNTFNILPNSKDVLRIRFTESGYYIEEHYSI
jgi:hypothetical protein